MGFVETFGAKVSKYIISYFDSFKLIGLLKWWIWPFLYNTFLLIMLRPSRGRGVGAGGSSPMLPENNIQNLPNSLKIFPVLPKIILPLKLIPYSNTASPQLHENFKHDA